MSTSVLEKPTLSRLEEEERLKLNTRYSGEYIIATDVANRNMDGVYVKFIEYAMGKPVTAYAVIEEIPKLAYSSDSQRREFLDGYMLQTREQEPCRYFPPFYIPNELYSASKAEQIDYVNKRYQQYLAEAPGKPSDHENCCALCQCPAHLMPFLPCVPGAYTPSKQQVMNSLDRITGPLTV